MDDLSTDYSFSSDQRGFSLAQLMTSLAIMGVVASMAAPRVQAVVESMQFRGAVRDLAGALQKARVEAVTRNERVRVSASNATLTLHVDEDADGTQDTGELVRVRSFSEDAAGVDLAGSVTFLPNGRVVGATTFTVANADVGRSVPVFVSTAGRVRVGS